MKYLIIVMIVLTSCRIAAQEKDTSTLKINNRVAVSITAGLTQSWLRGQDMAKLSSNGTSTSLSGFHLGVTLKSMWSNRFSFKHELMATQKGSGITQRDSVNGEYNTDLKWWSLDLFPLSPTWRYKGFSIYGGPYLSLLIDARIRVKDSNGQFQNDHSIFGSGRNFQRQSNYMQKFDYGLNVGLGYEFKNGLNFGVRYVRGFAEIFDWANSLTVGKPATDATSISIYSEYLNFSIGYDLGKKKRESNGMH